MTLERTTPPPRGTRPRNRRALIIAAGRDLLYRRGYEQFNVSDIADAVGISPSALYRHFSGKQELLREILHEGLAPVRAAFASIDLTDRNSALSQLAAMALDQRQLGILWQREARHLPRPEQDALRAELVEIRQLLADSVRVARPDLSATSALFLTGTTLSVLTSISFHHLTLARPAYDELIAELVELVLDTTPPHDLALGEPDAAGRTLLVPRSRREALLSEATRLFAREGYATVGIEDIGGAVGITGPSVYNHFSSKSDLLVTAIRRGTAALFLDLTAVYAAAGDASDALRRLIAAYLRFTQDHHHLIDLMITEIGHMPEDDRHLARQAQHEYISEWEHLLRIARPELDPTTARIRVHAALTVVNDAARSPQMRRGPAHNTVLEAICIRLLKGALSG